MPTDNVHVIRTERPVNTTAVERLELALADAKAGNIVSVAIASVTFDGGARTAFSTADNGVLLLGAVEILRGRVSAGMVEEK